MDAKKLLTVWETGRSAAPLERAILLLAVGLGPAAEETIRQYPLGLKERKLLILRQQIFGPQLEVVAACPICAEQLEFSILTADLMQTAPQALPETAELPLDDVTLTVRPLTINDLILAQGDGHALFERAVVTAVRHGEELVPDDLSAEAAAAVADQLRTLDPLMALTFDLTCPACEHAWSAPFDPLTFLWAEIERWGQRMLQTVHTLASTYGWSEEDILNMSAWRRDYYVELIRS